MSTFMQPHHHLNDEMLLDYAAGSLDEASSILVTSHMTLCPICRKRLRSLEAVGGMLLEDIDATAVSDGALNAILSRLDEPEKSYSATTPAFSSNGTAVLPAPLRKYLGGDLDDIRWEKKGGGVAMANIKTSSDGPNVFMLKVDPTRAVPQHTHEGNEFVMVLTGGYTDGAGHFVRGDVEVSDQTVVHQPVADAGEPCVILAVTDAPIRFTGPFGKILGLFVKM